MLWGGGSTTLWTQFRGDPARCEDRPCRGEPLQDVKINSCRGGDGGGSDISDTTAGGSQGGSESRGTDADDFLQLEGSSDIGKDVKIASCRGGDGGGSDISDTTGGGAPLAAADTSDTTGGGAAPAAAVAQLLAAAGLQVCLLQLWTPPTRRRSVRRKQLWHSCWRQLVLLQLCLLQLRTPATRREEVPKRQLFLRQLCLQLLLTPATPDGGRCAGGSCACCSC